jgi:NAD+ diphosphatase
MIQDISPSRLDCAYADYEMRNEDASLFFDKEGRLLVGKAEIGKDPVGTGAANGKDMAGNGVAFTTGKDAEGKAVQYLFSLDDKRFFLVMEESELEKEGFEYHTIREIRDIYSGKEVFAVFTAYHLWKWYADNRFCGRCGAALVKDNKERALRCPDCGNVIYPRINPAVIVGVTKGDSILITRYNRGYAHNALVAGFTEIGETLEETVAREVMEETGVRVKNIRYYKSQPWGMAQDVLVGFFCDAEGDSEIHMDENELKYAEWVKREDIVLQPNNLSLTNEMMRMFKEHRI